MISPGPRLVALGAVATCALAAPDAAAQDTQGLVELQLQLPDRDENHEDASSYADVTNEVEIRRYFNLARCQCSQNFGLEMQILNSSQAPQRPVELFVGSSCDDVELRDMLCEDLGSPFGDASNDLRNPQTVLIPIDAVADPNTRNCPDSELTARTYVMVDDDGDPSQFAYVDIFELFLDLNPPPLPRQEGQCLDVLARGSENSIVVTWELSETRIDDFEFFQILCAEVTGPDTVEPVFDNPEPAEYETARQICGGEVPEVVPVCGGDTGGADAGPEDAGPGDAGPGDGGVVLPPGLADLDEAFVCGTSTFGANDIRVTGLENGVEYRVLWVGIDPSRNPTVIDLGTATPGPLVDFWEDYKNQGGGAKGGYCFVATAAYGDYDHPMVVVLRDFRDNTLAKFGLGRWLIRTYYDLSPPLADFIAEHAAARLVARVLLWPLVVAAGLWEYTGFFAKLALILAFVMLRWLLRRRRRPVEDRRERRPVTGRRRAAVAAAAAAAVLLVANAASAQTYFEELEEEGPSEPSPSDVKWNFELKFGPYVPDVDSEFEGTGPFERVFGDGPFLMSQIALDRFFLWPRGGQLGASLGLGFLTKKAPVFADDDGDGVADVDMDGNPIRVSGENTSFRLIPLSASAVYRLTLLDDQFHVPIVPYGRLGLSYYLWWVTRPDGSTARACEDPGGDPETCQTTVGRGGTLGFQGTVGLALRAERIDADAGVHLRNELGIEHAGLFVELTYAQVDGFGAESKLSVGDLTWFGGVNFEF